VNFFFLEFRKLTSIYFLLICIITWIPEISPLNPWTTAFGLIFILAVAAVREAYEDYLRLKADLKVNNERFITLELNSGELLSTRSCDIHVGDLVFIQCDERIPSDLVLLASSHPDGVAFIETSQLDGETNLKHRKAPKETTFLSLAQLTRLRGECKVETPHHLLYEFKGSLWMEGSEGNISLDGRQLLLMNSVMRNTDWAVGLCVSEKSDFL